MFFKRILPLSSPHPSCRQSSAGFTLIELSIVLVIIGLIVGGVLVGKDLISAATVRAQISQNEKLMTAVNTFRTKFNALPGDIQMTSAAQFGFDVTGCDGTSGKRDGDFSLIGVGGQYKQGGGETGLFWNDLSSAAAGNLIEGSFSAATCTSAPTLSSTQYSQYLPAAKMGTNFLEVYYNSSWFGVTPKNYYQIVKMSSIISGTASVTVGMTVAQANAIDTKVDDGKAESGIIMAAYNNTSGMFLSYSNSTDNAITCYNSSTGVYSISVNNGTGVNCALSMEIR